MVLKKNLRKQKIQINDHFLLWRDMSSKVTQRSILGSVLFSINDLELGVTSELAKFAATTNSFRVIFFKKKLITKESPNWENKH